MPAGRFPKNADIEAEDVSRFTKRGARREKSRAVDQNWREFELKKGGEVTAP